MLKQLQKHLDLFREPAAKIAELQTIKDKAETRAAELLSNADINDDKTFSELRLVRDRGDIAAAQISKWEQIREEREKILLAEIATACDACASEGDRVRGVVEKELDSLLGASFHRGWMGMVQSSSQWPLRRAS